MLHLSRSRAVPREVGAAAGDPGGLLRGEGRGLAARHLTRLNIPSQQALPFPQPNLPRPSAQQLITHVGTFLPSSDAFIGGFQRAGYQGTHLFPFSPCIRSLLPHHRSPEVWESENPRFHLRFLLKEGENILALLSLHSISLVNSPFPELF